MTDEDDEIEFVMQLVAGVRDLHAARAPWTSGIGSGEGELADEQRLERTIKRLRALGSITVDPAVWAGEEIGSAIGRGLVDVIPADQGWPS